ncbi:MAG: alpha/beta fold hydrolase [Dehalococcoidia bacterium]|nr:MAG: alpha/beta fold hydrolase [Dehalococcoidia bacterium]
MEKTVTFKSSNEAIYANLGIPYVGAPCVIMSHGMEGSKDGKKWLELASRLYKTGFAYMRFNYRGCGTGKEISQGNFENTTLTSRIQDYRSAVNFVNNIAVDNNRIAVIGSSFGGTVTIAAGQKEIKAMVALATPCRFDIPNDDMYLVYQGEKFFELPSGRRLKREFFSDIKRYDIYSAIEKINCPLLVIHGDKDNMVPQEDAHLIYNQAKAPKRLEIIRGGNHGFDEPKHLELMIGLAIDWFKQYL